MQERIRVGGECGSSTFKGYLDLDVLNILKLPDYLVPEATISIVHLMESKEMKAANEFTSTNQLLDDVSMKGFWFRRQSGHVVCKALSQNAKWTRLFDSGGN